MSTSSDKVRRKSCRVRRETMDSNLGRELQREAIDSWSIVARRHW